MTLKDRADNYDWLVYSMQRTERMCKGGLSLASPGRIQRAMTQEPYQPDQIVAVRPK